MRATPAGTRLNTLPVHALSKGVRFYLGPVVEYDTGAGKIWNSNAVRQSHDGRLLSRVRLHRKPSIRRRD